MSGIFNPDLSVSRTLPSVHEVKSWPTFFGEIIAGRKLHDLRRNTDRQYTTGDYLFHREYDPTAERYTGRVALSEILYVTDATNPCAYSEIGLQEGFAILSISIRAVGGDVE